jgi:hypothetical protein
MAEHLWLKNRALCLQERAYYKARNTLLQLKEQKRKAQIGFVSQKAKEATETRCDEINQLSKKHLTAGTLLLESRLARETAAQAA